MWVILRVGEISANTKIQTFEGKAKDVSVELNNEALEVEDEVWVLGGGGLQRLGPPQQGNTRLLVCQSGRLFTHGTVHLSFLQYRTNSFYE